MGGGRIGEMVFNDPPGSFGSMNVVDQMSLERSLRETREKMRKNEKLQEIAQLLGKEVNRRTIENQGENDD